MTLNDHYQDSNDIQNEDGLDVQSGVESEDEETIIFSNKKNYQSCVKCAYKMLYKFHMYSLMHPQLHKAYKFISTIPLIQVSCERAFFKLFS